ncbi:MAG: hypothetical protein PWR06_291 [Thermoanaerobacteraceae bacterium]|nr:hypothetical protein [Thermoanaerobacteraceae bacterium]
MFFTPTQKNFRKEMQELKKIMDENGYKYETLENGGIRYWVNSY